MLASPTTQHDYKVDNRDGAFQSIYWEIFCHLPLV